MGGLACLAHENRHSPCGLVQTERRINEDCNGLCNIGVCYPDITFIVDISLHVVEPNMSKQFMTILYMGLISCLETLTLNTI